MSIPLTINGAVFEYPVDFDENWGVDATGWAQAVTNGMLQMSGGSFPLTANVNFGPNFGLLSKYFETRSSNPATIGTLRLASADPGIAFRNNANSANLILTTNAADNLLFNGVQVGTGGTVNAGTANQLAYYPASAAAVSGLTLITANSALISNASGLPIASSVTAATLAFLDATSSVQTQLNSISTVANAALPKAGGTMSGNIAMGSNKVTGLAAATTNGDATRFEQTVLTSTDQTITGIKTFSGQLIGKGTATSDNAAAGFIGEYISATATFTNVSGTNQYSDLTSVSLTAGDWDVTGCAYFTGNGATYSKGSLGISTTAGNSATGLVSGDNRFDMVFANTSATITDFPLYVTGYRVSIGSTTTYYLKYLAVFTSGTPQAAGRISARRVR